MIWLICIRRASLNETMVFKSAPYNFVKLLISFIVPSESATVQHFGDLLEDLDCQLAAAFQNKFYLS